MRIGVPTEIKADEYRVALTPAGVRELAARGHEVVAQAGAFMLERPLGGRGVLLGGVPGVAAGTAMVIGGGVVGQNAAKIALGLGADVFVFDRSIDRLRELDAIFDGRVSTCYASSLE